MYELSSQKSTKWLCILVITRYFTSDSALVCTAGRSGHLSTKIDEITNSNYSKYSFHFQYMHTEILNSTPGYKKLFGHFDQMDWEVE